LLDKDTINYCCMMRRKLIVCSFLFLAACTTVAAQKKIILEKLRCYSLNGPVMNYFKNDEIRRTIALELNETLKLYQKISLVDTSRLIIEIFPNRESIHAGNPDFKDADTSHLHLYIDLFEVDPAVFFAKPENDPHDSMLVKRAASLFLLQTTLFTADKKVTLNESLDVVVSPSETPGIGILYSNSFPYRNLLLTPKGFTEMLKAATNLLFDPKNELIQVEMKAAPAYFADNYILAKTTDQPRTYVTMNKNISTYHYKGENEMIRLGDAVYEEIKIKGKKAEKYPDDLTNAIREAKNFASSDFVFLRQDCRDVLRDKNYLIKMTVQVDPDNPTPMGELFTFTDFLPGSFHYLLSEKDTLARFIIQKKVPDKEKKIYAGKISNGYDSTSLFTFNTDPGWAIIYDYVVTGTIGRYAFQIKCSGFRNTVKEIYVNKKLACIAQGKFNPEKFVVFDASLSPELLNQLLMIGFNRFFE